MFNTARPKFQVKILKAKDKDFTFSPDGFTLVPRAAIEISQRCPENYKDLIQECIRHGWVKPIAYMKDTEYFWETLQNDHAS
jgi:hypothetical protein